MAWITEKFGPNRRWVQFPPPRKAGAISAIPLDGGKKSPLANVSSPVSQIAAAQDANQKLTLFIVDNKVLKYNQQDSTGNFSATWATIPTPFPVGHVAPFIEPNSRVALVVVAANSAQPSTAATIAAEGAPGSGPLGMTFSPLPPIPQPGAVVTLLQENGVTLFANSPVTNAISPGYQSPKEVFAGNTATDHMFLQASGNSYVPTEWVPSCPLPGAFATLSTYMGHPVIYTIGTNAAINVYDYSFVVELSACPSAPAFSLGGDASQFVVTGTQDAPQIFEIDRFTQQIYMKVGHPQYQDQWTLFDTTQTTNLTTITFAGK